MTLTVGSLFSGIGGLELGLEAAGFRVLWQVEKDKYCRAVLAKNWPDVTRYEDVHHVGIRNLQWVDIVCGGFPCQDVSHAGRRAGIVKGNRSGLWHEFARVVRELRPRFVLVENVSALLVRGIDIVLADLAALGYDAVWDSIPASYIGAPHRRDRVWIVGYARGEPFHWLQGRSGAAGSGSLASTESVDANDSDRRRDPPVADAEGESLRAGLRANESARVGRGRSGDSGSAAAQMADSECVAVQPERIGGEFPRAGGTVEGSEGLSQLGAARGGGEDVADSGSSGQRSHDGGLPGRESDAVGSGSELANANGDARHERRARDTGESIRERDADRSALSADGVADTDSVDAHDAGSRAGEICGRRPEPTDILGGVADAERSRLEGLAGDGENGGGRARSHGSIGPKSIREGGDPGSWWATEPDVGRVVDGVSSHVDCIGGIPISGAPQVKKGQKAGRVQRLTALGNAVVPYAAEWIGWRIREAINDV